MVFVFIFSLMGFAFVQLEYDESPSLEGSSVSWGKGYFPVESFLPGIPLAIFAMILLFEYMRSHIGKKHFVGRTIELGDLSPIVSFLTTALLGSSFVLIASRKD